jgi:hypothetical protein
VSTDRERFRDWARAEVEQNAEPATAEQAALIQTALGPGAAEHAARRQETGDGEDTAA